MTLAVPWQTLSTSDHQLCRDLALPSLLFCLFFTWLTWHILHISSDPFTFLFFVRFCIHSSPAIVIVGLWFLWWQLAVPLMCPAPFTVFRNPCTEGCIHLAYLRFVLLSCDSSDFTDPVSCVAQQFKAYSQPPTPQAGLLTDDCPFVFVSKSSSRGILGSIFCFCLKLLSLVFTMMTVLNFCIEPWADFLWFRSFRPGREGRWHQLAWRWACHPHPVERSLEGARADANSQVQRSWTSWEDLGRFETSWETSESFTLNLLRSLSDLRISRQMTEGPHQRQTLVTFDSLMNLWSLICDDLCQNWTNWTIQGASLGRLLLHRLCFLLPVLRRKSQTVQTFPKLHTQNVSNLQYNW